MQKEHLGLPTTVQYRFNQKPTLFLRMFRRFFVLTARFRGKASFDRNNADLAGGAVRNSGGVMT